MKHTARKSYIINGAPEFIKLDKISTVKLNHTFTKKILQKLYLKTNDWH